MKGLYLLALALCINMNSYAGFKIATGEPLHSQQQIYAAKGRMGILIKQKLTFGDYYTTMVKRSAIRKWSGIDGFPGMIWTEHMQGRQSVHFRLSNGTDTSDVMAVSRVSARDLLIGTAPGTTRLPGSIVALFKSTEISNNNYSVSIVNKTGEEPCELLGLWLYKVNNADHRRNHDNEVPKRDRCATGLIRHPAANGAYERTQERPDKRIIKWIHIRKLGLDEQRKRRRIADERTERHDIKPCGEIHMLAFENDKLLSERRFGGFQIIHAKCSSEGAQNNWNDPDEPCIL